MTEQEAREATVSAKEVMRELAKHDCTDSSMENFQTEYGIHTMYCGDDVLNFLGY